MKKRPTRNVDAHNGFGEWGGYMDAKKAKLEEQFAEDALKNPYKQSDLFRGVSIFVNGLTNPSADELKRIMMSNGGVYHTYQRSSTTFVIATNLPDVKIRQITSAKIISPQWVVDCLKEKRILDYSKYLLYTNSSTTQPKLAFAKKDIYEKKPVDTPNIKPKPSIEASNTKRPDDNQNILSPVTESKVILTNLNILNTVLCGADSPKKEAVATKPHDIQPKNEIKKGAARTAVDPNFLTEFYNNSRLHHIATLGAGFKGHISKLRESHNGKFPACDLLKQLLQSKRIDQTIDAVAGKVVMHIDMDCFFVSVGLRSRPHLKGYPIAVTHSKGATGNNLKTAIGVDRRKEMELYVKRHDDKYKVDESLLDDEERLKTMPLIDNTTSLSEIASCSYEARKMGVKNGMFVGAALKLCPDLKTIPYDFEAYKEVANILYDTITQYTMDVEAVSCDEMYVNLTNVIKTINCSVDEFVTHIRNEIIEKTQCPCSAGIGENKLQARMATKKAKPNGQFHLLPEKVEEYFSDILISDLPGVGYSTTQKLNNLTLKTCADLQQVPMVKLQHDFGKKLGETLYQYCRGIDNKPLAYDQVRKSVSAEVNYGIRFTEQHELDTFLKQLCSEVHSRLKEVNAKGKTITLKYMVRAQDAPVETAKFMGHGFCDHVTKSTTLPAPTSDLDVINQTICNIKNILNVPAKELRGIGIQISKLDIIQNEVHKPNALKNMFERVHAKNAEKMNEKTCDKLQFAGPSNSTITTKNSKTLRKIKSFNGTPTRDFNDNFQIKPPNRDMYKVYEELDVSVLAELPDDIRMEILQEQQRILKITPTKTTVKSPSRSHSTSKKFKGRKLENDFLDEDALTPPKNGMECSKMEEPLVQFISDENILKSTDWRRLLMNWIESGDNPVSCDIKMIGEYVKEFAQAKRLNEIVIFLRYMHRKVEHLHCNWHRVYYGFTNETQRQIAFHYGADSSLEIPEKFNCIKCANKKLVF